MPSLPSFADLASESEPAMDALALAMAAEFRTVDVAGAMETLDALGEALSRAVSRTSQQPLDVALACGQLLGREYGLVGDRRHYDAPGNSMLDVVLAQRRGLPIVLSVIYTEVARRAGVQLAGVGLAGHFVVGHFGSDPPVLLDPFNRGARIDAPASGGTIRPWHPHDIASRMLNNLVGSYLRRGNVGLAIRAAQMRLTLPADGPLRDALTAELRALQARLN